MFLKSYYEKILRKEKGVIIAMTAVMIPIIFGFAGLAYDVGNLYVQKGNLQHIADASALAGAEVYRNIAANKDTSDQISADEGFDNNTYSTTRPSDADFSISNHGYADKFAWDYVDKNKGNRTISVNGPYALEGTISVQTSEGHSNINGVYYRVRLAEEVPLHFLPLIPGLGKQQEVVAESIVALSTDVGTDGKTVTTSTTEYIKVFDNLFTYNLNADSDGGYSGSAVSAITDGQQPVKGVDDQKNIRLYSYMMYMNHQTNAIVNYYKNNSLSNGSGKVYIHNQNTNSTSYTHVLNDVYNNYDTWKDERFANIEVTPSGNLTVNINYNLTRPYLYFNNNHDYYEYLTAGNYYTTYYGDYDRRNQSTYLQAGYYKVTITSHSSFFNTYYTYNYTAITNNLLNKAFELPLYIYKETSGSSTINVTANSNTSCYPIVFYQYDKFHEDDNPTVSLTINNGQIFRGIIIAPDSKVTITNNGTFEGSVLAKSIVANGSGTYIQKNIFQNANNEYAAWYTNYLGLNYIEVDALDANGNVIYNGDGTPKKIRKPTVNFVDSGTTVNDNSVYVPDSTNSQWKDFLKQLKSQSNATSIWYYDADGNKITTKNSTFYDSLYYNEYGLNLQKYAFGSQEWFESLNLEQKARLAYFWEYIYTSNNKMQWLWAQPATKEYEDVIPGIEAIKSLRLINSRTEANPFTSS